MATVAYIFPCGVLPPSTNLDKEYQAAVPEIAKLQLQDLFNCDEATLEAEMKTFKADCMSGKAYALKACMYNYQLPPPAHGGCMHHSSLLAVATGMADEAVMKFEKEKVQRCSWTMAANFRHTGSSAPRRAGPVPGAKLARNRPSRFRR